MNNRRFGHLPDPTFELSPCSTFPKLIATQLFHIFHSSPMSTNLFLSSRLPHTTFITESRFNLPSLTTRSVSRSMTSVSASAKTVNVRVKGVVQGVFYRKWTEENAKELGIKGWVRNRRDGSVEALFSGEPDLVDNMIERCKRGPSSAIVTGLEVNPSQENPGESFELKPTC